MEGESLTLYQFNALDMDSRGAYLWANGDYITGVVDAQGRSNFYVLRGYFVEVELFDEGDAIAAAIPFTTGDRYDRMLCAVETPKIQLY